MIKGYRDIGYGLGLSSPPGVYKGACELYERWLAMERKGAATTDELALARILSLLAEIEAVGDVRLPADQGWELVADKLELETLILGLKFRDDEDRVYPYELEKWLDDRAYAAWRSRLRSLYQAQS